MNVPILFTAATLTLLAALQPPLGAQGLVCESDWRPTFGGQAGGPNGAVQAMLVHDDGNGPVLYAAGSFTQVGSISANRIARWNGASWSPLGLGLNGTVKALVVHDDGSGGGPALFAGGSFTTAGLVAASQVARWDGTAWSPLAGGPGFSNDTRALAVYDDGSGPALYAGGRFGLKRWDGATWSSVGTGFDWCAISCMLVHDDGQGGGPQLYVGGRDLDVPGDMNGTGIARWNGSAWSMVGQGIVIEYLYDDGILALAEHDDGNGPALYAGGWFNPNLFPLIAKWNGSTWSAVGGGANQRVQALASFDDGGGPALYAGGMFTSPGNGVAKWNGASWSPLGGGVSGTVSALATWDSGSGATPLLLVGGSFQAPSADLRIAAWGCASAPLGTAYCFGDGSGTPCPCSNPGGAGLGCANSSGAGARLDAGGSASVSADSLAFQAQNLIPFRSALLFVGLGAPSGGAGVVFGDGLRCASVATRRLGVRTADLFGEAEWGPALSPAGQWLPGDTRHFQAWYRDPTSSPCASGFNLTQGYRVTFTP